MPLRPEQFHNIGYQMMLVESQLIKICNKKQETESNDLVLGPMRTLQQQLQLQQLAKNSNSVRLPTGAFNPIETVDKMLQIKPTVISGTDFDLKPLLDKMNLFFEAGRSGNTFAPSKEKEPQLQKALKELLVEGEKFIAYFNEEKNKRFIERPPENFEHVSEFFRALLNYIDRLITYVRGAEKTSAETSTYGARMFRGRKHYLNAPETELGTAFKDFENACAEIKEHLPQPSQQNKM